MEDDDFHNQVRMEYYRSNVQAAREIGIITLRTLVTLNSGAFVILLTFIGNTAAQSRFIVPLSNLKNSMYLFLTGLALSFAAIAYTYVITSKVSPYPEPPSRTDGWFIYIIVIVTAFAFLSFLAGVFVVISGVQIP